MCWSTDHPCVNSFVKYKTKLQSFWYESHIQFSPMRPGPNVAQLTLGQVVKKAVKSTKNMQHNMAKDKQKATESAPIIFDSTTGQQYFVSASSPSLKHADRPQQKPHNTTWKGVYPKHHCKALKAEDSASVNMCFLTLILGMCIQKVQCKARERALRTWTSCKISQIS